MSDPRAEGLRAYVTFLEGLKPDRLADLERYCAADIHFRDPFNDTRGVSNYRRVLDKMFEDIEVVGFTVRRSLRDEDAASLAWTMVWRGRRGGGGPTRTIEGMTEVALTPEGLIAAHIDHWDAASQLYELVPGLGFLLTRIRRRLSAD